MSRILEHDVQLLASALEAIWEAEWDRADLCLLLVEAAPPEWIRLIARELGRSHRCIERWAALARAFPPGTRAQDRSPRDHARQVRSESLRATDPKHGQSFPWMREKT